MKSKTRKILMYCSLGVIALICIRLLFFETTLKYGVILLAGIALAFLIWKAFIKNSNDALKQARDRENLLSDQIDSLKQTVSSLKRELDEKDKSKINVVGLNPILHVAVLDIDSSFTRPFIRKDGNQTFYGAIRADISAEYGIKMEEVKFRYDRDNNLLYLRDFHPGLISFSKKQLSWEFANGYKTVNVFGKEFQLYSDSYTKDKCEELRQSIEKEIDERKIEEFNWLSPLLTKQVGDMFKLMLNHPEAEVLILEDNSEDDREFIKFSDFKELLSPAGKAALSSGDKADDQEQQQE